MSRTPKSSSPVTDRLLAEAGRARPFVRARDLDYFEARLAAEKVALMEAVERLRMLDRDDLADGLLAAHRPLNLEGRRIRALLLDGRS